MFFLCQSEHLCSLTWPVQGTQAAVSRQIHMQAQHCHSIEQSKLKSIERHVNLSYSFHGVPIDFWGGGVLPRIPILPTLLATMESHDSFEFVWSNYYPGSSKPVDCSLSIHRWAVYAEGIPHCMKTDNPLALPSEVRFSFTKTTQFLFTASTR